MTSLICKYVIHFIKINNLIGFRICLKYKCTKFIILFKIIIKNYYIEKMLL